MKITWIKRLFQSPQRLNRPQMDYETLEKVFTALGVKDPAGWARSQTEEGIPQLGRYLFLRGCWDQAIDPVDDSWIDALIRQARAVPNSPDARVGEALARMLALGVPRSEIVELVRGMQKELIFGISYLIDDPHPAIERLPPEAQDALKDFGWSLVEVGPDGAIGPPISGLHESVQETDPRGAA
jgi:hypothetical protein